MSVALSEHLPLLATAPDGIQKLRELILQMAVMGKLVPQDPNDEPASELLNRIAKERGRLESEGIIKKTKPLMPVAEDEQPFSVPDGWAWVRVATLGNTQTGTTPSKSESSLFGNDVPFIKPGDISAHGVDYENEGLSHQGALDSGRLAEAGSILMVCIGTIGKCSVIDRRCSFNQQINSVTPFIDVSQFAFNVFRSSYFQREAWARSSSTTIAILNKGNWELIPVPLPPLPEQHRIVAKVDELMALCDRLEAEQSDAESAHVQLVESLLRTLTQSTDAADLASNWQRIAEHFDTLFSTELSIDAFKGSVLQLAVMGRLVPQDPNDEPAEELLKHIQSGVSKPEVKAIRNKLKALRSTADDEVPFDIPGSWKWIRLSQLEPEYQNGESSRGAGAGVEMVVLRLADISSGELSLTHTRSMILPESSVEKYRLRKNDILVIRVNGSADIVGRLVLCDNNLDAIYCDHFIRLQFREAAIAHRYLRMLGDSPLVRNQIAKLFVSTAGQKTVNQGHIGGLRMPLPPLPEQHRIVAKVDELMALCDQMKADLREARAQQSRLADTLIGERFQ